MLISHQNLAIKFTIAVCTTIAGFVTPIFAAPTDFDQDGASDRVTSTTGQNNALSWKAVGDLAETDLGDAGVVGDYSIAGRWTESTQSVIGYVRRVGTGLSWNIKKDNELTSVSFGSSAGIIVSGGDYNGDGIIDAAVVTQNGTRKSWSTSADLFTAVAPSTVSTLHGGASGTPFFMNVSGLRDSIAVLHIPPAGNLMIRTRDLTTNEVHTMKRIPRSLLSFGRPMPIARADGTDALVFVRKGTGVTTVIVVAQNGRRIGRFVFPEAVDVAIGDYLPDEPGEELGFAGSSRFNVVNPFSTTSQDYDPTSGAIVDEININQFSIGDYAGLPDPRDTCYEQDPTDGYKLRFIWKPKSDTQFGSVVIMPGTYLNKISSLKSLTTSGEAIKTFAFKGNANPDPGGSLRPHYIDRTTEGPTYRSQYGSIMIRVDLINGACLYYPIANPAQRVD